MQYDSELEARPHEASLAIDPPDSDQFAERIEPYRRELQAYCYRMLGNVHDAQDLAQDALIRAWRARHSYEGRASLRTWLYKIATNACLNALRRQPPRSLPMAHGSPARIDAPIPGAVFEPVWLEPYPDAFLAGVASDPDAAYQQYESITLAFMAVLHRLPARQRAVLILSDVLDWSGEEIAGLLEMTVPAVKSALFRARRTMTTHYQPVEAVESLPGAAQQDFVERYVRAWERADVDGLVRLLATDATYSMPPLPVWYQGRGVIRWLVGHTVFAGAPAHRWRLLPTRASGRLAFGIYKFDEQAGAFLAYAIQVVSQSGACVRDITTCINASLIAQFGLPATVAAQD